MTDVINSKYTDSLSEHTKLYKDAISCVVNFIPIDLEIEYMKKETEIIEKLNHRINESVNYFKKYPNGHCTLVEWMTCDICDNFHDFGRRSLDVELPEITDEFEIYKELDIKLFDNIEKIIYDKYKVYIKIRRVDPTSEKIDVILSKN